MARSSALSVLLKFSLTQSTVAALTTATIVASVAVANCAMSHTALGAALVTGRL